MAGPRKVGPWHQYGPDIVTYCEPLQRPGVWKVKEIFTKPYHDLRMRLPGTDVGSHLEKDEGGLVELFMEMDAVAFVNLVAFLLLLVILVLLYHLLRRRSKAKAAAMMVANCWQQKQALPLAKRVNMPGFDFSVRQSCFSSLKQQIQRKTPLGRNSQRKGLFGFPTQGRDIPSTSAICLHLQGEPGPISCLMPARRNQTRLLPKGSSLVQTSPSSHVFPTIRANPISNPSKSLDNLIHNFCPSDFRAKLDVVVNAKSVPNFYGCKSTIFAKSSLRWVRRQTEVQAKSLPNLYKRSQAAAKKNHLTCPLLTPTFARGPHVKPSYSWAKKSPKHGKSSASFCMYHQHSTTTANSKSLFCLEKFQS